MRESIEMTRNGSKIIRSLSALATVAVMAIMMALAWPAAGSGQAQPPDQAKHQHPAAAPRTDESLAEQVRQLRAKVATLEAALAQAHRSGVPAAGGRMGMMGGGQGMGMGMMDDMDMGMMGMGTMGRARGMAGMTMGSALPGFPGASHLYHIGSTGFFLDHGEHISLTDAQKAELNRIKERALLEGATARRKVDEAEQALWTLTAADEPDVEAIASKAKDVEAIRSDQRLAFIRAVGEAAKVLTPEQRQQLVGAAAPSTPAP